MRRAWWRWRARRALLLARRVTTAPALAERARQALTAAITRGDDPAFHDTPELPACIEELVPLAIRAGDLAAADELVARRVALSERADDRASRLALAEFLYRVTLQLRAARQNALAEPHARRALVILEGVVTSSDPRIEQALDTLASIELRLGKLGEAEALLTRLLDIEERRAAGAGGMALASTLNRLAQVKRAQGKHGEAGVIDERVAALRAAPRD